MKYTYDCKINGFKSCPNNRSGDVQITDPASRGILLGLAPKFSTVSAAAAAVTAVSALASPLSAALFFSSGVVDAFCLGDLVLRINW